jgi:hypothetical protein
MWWSRFVVFSDGGTPPTNVDIKNRASIDKWTVVHEFAHAWDRNYGWTLSNGLGGYTGDRPKNCDTNNRLPGCNAAGLLLHLCILQQQKLRLQCIRMIRYFGNICTTQIIPKQQGGNKLMP